MASKIFKLIYGNAERLPRSAGEQGLGTNGPTCIHQYRQRPEKGKPHQFVTEAPPPMRGVAPQSGKQAGHRVRVPLKLDGIYGLLFQGLMRPIPQSSKSAVLRVANSAPREWAMAAICASNCEIGRPAWRRLAAIAAYASAASES